MRWRAGTQFRCEKRPATAAKGMVVTNHPLASVAGAEILPTGGNARVIRMSRPDICVILLAQ